MDREAAMILRWTLDPNSCCVCARKMNTSENHCKIVIDTVEMHQVGGEVAFRYISTIAVFDCWRKSMLSSSSSLQWLTLLDIIGLSQVWHWPW